MKEIIQQDAIIQHTKNWINKVVVGLNFCPFAAKVVKQKSILYCVLENEIDEKKCLMEVISQCEHLDKHEEISTTLIIFPNSFKQFESYLKLVAKAEKLLAKHDYEGIYQIASFHPDYRFADADENDAANFTNRSPYPMLHLLREESITDALEKFPDADSIPQQNIAVAQKKGLLQMQLLREECMR